uniref:cyclin-dependent kinase inhibitor 1B n=1 Tax=Myxine glutinosa TaxID=7769 RepID=UPI00358ED643
MMSDVRVPGGGSAGSGGAGGGSTLQPAARRSPLFPRAAVCRSLFGPVDHGETHKRLREELASVGEERKRRWDFDFDSEEPLRGGKFVWEAVEARAVPHFYRPRGFTHEAVSQARRPERDACRNREENKGEENGNVNRSNNRHHRRYELGADEMQRRDCVARRDTRDSPSERGDVESEAVCQLSYGLCKRGALVTDFYPKRKKGEVEDPANGTQ